MSNHDDHYASKDIEPIDVIEETVDRLVEKGLSPKSAFHIGTALKYYLRAGLKDGEDIYKDLNKGFNYMHRAKFGTWIETK